MKLRKILVNSRNLIKHYPFSSIDYENEKRISVDFSNNHATYSNLIPDKCMLTWEDNSFGRRHKKSLKKQISENRSFVFSFFDKFQRDSYMNDMWNDNDILKIYKSTPYGPMQADIFRYCYLYNEGGFYIDIGRKTPDLFNSYLSNDTQLVLFLQFYAHRDYTVANSEIYKKIPLQYIHAEFINSFFAAAPKSKFLEILINNIVKYSRFYCNHEFHYPRDGILSFTGPAMFKYSFFDYLQRYESQKVKFVEVDKLALKNSYLDGGESRWIKYPSYINSRNGKICNL